MILLYLYLVIPDTSNTVKYTCTAAVWGTSTQHALEMSTKEGYELGQLRQRLLGRMVMPQTVSRIWT